MSEKELTVAEKCTAECDERVGSVCMKYGRMIMRNRQSNQYDHVSFSETGIKNPLCLAEVER